jgi:predicted ATPase
MINSLRLQRFKCFADQAFELRNLTLLAGENASGKSTVIQALLLLKQSQQTGQLERGELTLNGRLINIGTAKDALYSHSQEDSIGFSLVGQEQTQSARFEFAYQRGNPEAYTLYSQDSSISQHPINLFTEKVTYLSAERLGPRLLYPMSDRRGDELTVGVQGEFTAHCLAEFGNETMPNFNLAYPGEDNLQLRYQTELWIRQIVPNIDIEVEAINAADQVRIGFRNQGDTDYWRPTNIGFGVSYTLPIIVAALMSKPESILIVENPEAHLHPASQSRIGQFLAQTAATGVQVVIETHSDHILNGVRLAIRRKMLNSGKVSIQFFQCGDENEPHRVISPRIDADGRIDKWPSGFFDQLEKDLMELF